MNHPVAPWSMLSLHKVARVAASFVIGIGCLVLIGWILHIDLLKSVLPGLVTMKVNTALGFVLSGTSLAFLIEPSASKQRLFGRLCSLMVIVLGSATLTEYLFGWDFGIDQWLIADDPRSIATLNPGRMSPLTAVCFVLVGSALWLGSVKTPQTKTHWMGLCNRWIEVLAVLVSVLAAQVLIAYLYQVQAIIGSIVYTQMAVHTAFCFVVLGVGILLAHPGEFRQIITSEGAAGVTARRLLPAAIAIPFVLGWLVNTSERMGLFEPAFGTSLLVVLYIILFAGLIIWNTRRLHQIDVQRQKAVEALHQINHELEARIAARTADLREANDRLSQSEERLSLAIDGAGMATWDMDLQTGRMLWSAQHFRLMGYERAPDGEASLEMWQSRIHPDDLEYVMQAKERAQREQTLYCPEHRIIRVDNGQVVWLRVFGRFIYNEIGQAVRFIGILFDDTEKKQAQEERDHFFTLSLDMLCIAGIDGYFKQLNPSWERVLGYTRAELMAQPFINFVHPDDRSRTLIEKDNHAAGAPAVNFENRYRCQDGSYRWLSWTSVAAPEKGLLYSVARDVTSRKQSEQQLEFQAATLQRQADLLELAYEAIIVRDEQGAITYWSRGAESMYGWSREEAIGHMTPTFLQTQLSEPAENLDQMLLQQERWQGELTHTCKDNRQIVVESRQVIIRDRQGQTTGFLEVNRDITERKQSELELRNLNQELQRLVAESQTLLDVIPIGIGIATDPDCKTIRVNPAFAQHLGIPTNINASLSAPEDERPNFKVYQDGRELAPEELPLQYAATHGTELRDLEVDVIWEGGRVVNLLEYAAPLFDEAGRTRGSVGAFLDITDRKQAEAEIRQLNATLEQRVEERTAQLQEANRDLEAFSYTVAHDLRAPLRGIQAFAQALVEDYGGRLDDIAQDYIQQIFDGTDRMNELVNDLLAYSRLSREQIKLSPVRLIQVVADAQAQLGTELHDLQAEIIVAEDLPTVMGYRPILVQIVVNLLSNAIKFVAYGVQPQIQIWAEVLGDGQVRLWVEDNGIGIEPNYREQIFGVFERLHGREAYPGTGIGLAIVRKGAERLGGRAGVESSTDHGSRFWVELQGVVF